MARTKLNPSDPAITDAYYKAMQARKLAAGLPLADAIEITARQRAEDDVNPDFAVPEPETPPEA